VNGNTASGDTAIGRFEIVNVKGLHARAAMKLVQVASRYPGDVTVSGADGQAANAKSVMGVLLLCGSMGTVIEVQARGPDANSVVDAIGRLIADRFGEPE
jgi:phosphocarrier protein HPr